MPHLTLLTLAWLFAAASTAPETPVEPWTGMAFVRIPAGHFVMGSPESEPGREPQETRHDVDLTRPFEMGAYEVTQAQWQQVMGWNRSTFRGATRPVEQVNWIEIQEFLRRLTAHAEGVRFRLPSEAEWEYACRAGTTTAYATGDTLSQAAANYDGKETTPVGRFAPNAWGLYDMSGNVWEWTADEHCPYAGTAVTDPRPACGSGLKVIRGGSWYFGADSARCALRYTHPPQERGFSLGFRVVRVRGETP